MINTIRAVPWERSQPFFYLIRQEFARWITYALISAQSKICLTKIDKISPLRHQYLATGIYLRHHCWGWGGRYLGWSGCGGRHRCICGSGDGSRFLGGCLCRCVGRLVGRGVLVEVGRLVGRGVLVEDLVGWISVGGGEDVEGNGVVLGNMLDGTNICCPTAI